MNEYILGLLQTAMWVSAQRERLQAQGLHVTVSLLGPKDLMNLGYFRILASGRN